MSNIYEELSNAMSHAKKLRMDLEAIIEAAEQKPADTKTQERIDYLKYHKETREKKNDTERASLEEKKQLLEQSFDSEIEAIKKKKEMMEEKFDAEIEAIKKKKEMMEEKFNSSIDGVKQKKEIATNKLELKIEELKNCTTITYYENELKRLFDDIGNNRIKSQVEIRKQKELDETHKKIRDLEQTIEMNRIAEKQFSEHLEHMRNKNNRDSEFFRQRIKDEYEIHKQILENYPKPQTSLDDEDDFLPEPENEIIQTHY
jgi:hypothetical protein